MNKIIVNIGEQRLYLMSPSSHPITDYPVSTSMYGVGNENGSYKTPLGKHGIAEKIGTGCAMTEVFVGRQPIGQFDVLQAGGHALPEDVIMCRILRLKGLEPGLNQGEAIDSYLRYIYIHGTSEENKIGQPASHGCVRLRNKDMIELFDRVDEGCQVNIIRIM